ncbi:MAG: hypothetical protein KatS3mg099_236 [Candidatus Parcubacteria bacterium]|nr:MAG: hypothetical protein KatS3mg099_236 [Candidatus Parcubacteria bacterium]
MHRIFRHILSPAQQILRQARAPGAQRRRITAVASIVSGGLVVAALGTAVLPPTGNNTSPLSPLPAGAIVGSPAGMCADSATNIAILQDLRDRIAASTDPDELQRLVQEFYSLQTHNQNDIQAAKNKGELEKEKERLLGRIATLRAADTEGAYTAELDGLESRTRSAANSQDLAPINDRVTFLEILLGLNKGGGGGGGDGGCQDDDCDEQPPDDSGTGDGNQGSEILTGFKPRLSFSLPGNGEDNVRSRIWLAFRKGESRPYFVQHDSLRLLRVFTPSGQMVWEYYQPNLPNNSEKRNPNLNVHHADGRTYDIDGDGTDEIVVCGAGAPGGSSGRVELRIYDLLTGAVRARYDLSGEPGLEKPDSRACEIDLVLFEGETAPYAIIATKGSEGKKKPGYTEVYSRTVALRLSPWKIEKRWIANTHQAGHSVWHYDKDRNGKAEFIWVGKYKIDKSGTIVTTPTGGAGWMEKEDHWDGVQIADIIPSRPGLEMVIVGASGMEVRDAEDAALIYQYGRPLSDNPQRAIVGDFVPEESGLEILVQQKGGGSALVSASGKVYWNDPKGPGTYELVRLINGREVMDLGNVAYAIDKNGYKLLLEKKGGWFGESVPSGMNGMLVWNPHGFAIDLWGDAREEIITWGRDRLIVGSFDDPTQPRLKQHEPFYWNRFKMTGNFARTVAPNPELVPW